MSLTRVPNTSDIIESDLPLCGKSDSSSTAAQSLQDFNEYNRIALPLSVEASLQSIVQSKIAPIEEEVRILFVDIVRRSQSTVAQDFHQAQQLKTAQVQPSESAFVTAQRSSHMFATDESYGAPMPVASNAISADTDIRKAAIRFWLWKQSWSLRMRLPPRRWLSGFLNGM